MTPSPSTVPRATYRLQFHGGFTFHDAAAIVPYLAELGISHIYASPYLKARAGSQHGYDIIDHNTINPEIGDAEAFSAFTAALDQHGMGQILDIVPNHMGIGRAENRWFLDVLAWGEESPFADFFDIDWRPAKPELHGKLLVPILGDHYGTVLSKGELRLTLDDSDDGFSVWYYEHRLPMAPGTYGRILRPAVDRFIRGQAPDAERAGRLTLLAAGFDELRHPAKTRIERTARLGLAERLRRDLAELMRSEADFRRQIEAIVGEINGAPGDPRSFRHLHQLLENQHYRLAYWRVAAEEINYRRFFQVNDLAGIRVELPEVFDATHRLIFQLIDDGRVQGLRIDHIDGLFDPRQYLHRLQERYRRGQAEQHNGGTSPGGLYVVIEKILAPHEFLPSEWPVAGTTGYDFLNRVNGVFVDPNGETALTATYEAFAPRMPSFGEIAYIGRKLAMEQELASELRVLANEMNQLTESNWFTRDYTLVGLRQALREIVACFPVYRTYIDWHGIRPEDRRDIDWAIAHGRRQSQRSDLSVFEFLQGLLTTDLGRGRSPVLNRREVRRLAMKFQQYTGAVMAKGVEDTAFYRYNRLLSLNEVGSHPTQFGTTLASFHRANHDAARRWPHAMLATATHDTKRGEDVRARINALSELAEEWSEAVQRWSTQNRRHKSDFNNTSAPDGNDEYLFYQSLVGVWPAELIDTPELDETAIEPLRRRMADYMLKAVREAKVHSSWINPNAEYEQALTSFVDRALDVRTRNPFLESFAPFARKVAAIGAVNSLAQTTLKQTSPGVPDNYQGCELWDLSLVDPDNRRPVDYERRAMLLRGLHQQWNGQSDAAWLADLLADWPSGRVKLFTTWRLLALRGSMPGIFGNGSYRAVNAEGPAAESVCAFLRSHADDLMLVVVPRLITRCGSCPNGWPIGPAPWAGTTLNVPGPTLPGPLSNIFTREPLPSAEILTDGAGLRFDVGALLARFPVGVWVTGHA